MRWADGESCIRLMPMNISDKLLGKALGSKFSSNCKTKFNLRYLSLILFLIFSPSAFALAPAFTGLKEGVSLNYMLMGYFSDTQAFSGGTTNADYENHFIRAKESGFTGIQFEITVSVDFEGKLLSNLTYDRLFEVSELAESLGLGTGILVSWTFNDSNSAYVNEYAISSISATFSFDEFLDSIGAFWSTFAESANKHDIDALHLGLFDGPIFFSSEYLGKWDEIISDVKSKYSGALLITFADLQAHHKIEDFSIWGQLDAISIWPKTFLTTSEIYDIDFLQSLFWLPPLENDNYINAYISASKMYNKPIMLINNAFAIDNGLDGGWDPTQNQLEERPLPVNNAIRDLAHQSFLHHFSNHLSEFVTSWTIVGGGPFSANIPDDAPGGGGSWKYFDLSLFPESTMSIFKTFFENGNHIKISNNVFASPLSETIHTRVGEYTIHTGGGFDTIYGGTGSDTIILENFGTVVSIDYEQYINTIGEHKVALFYNDNMIYEMIVTADSSELENGGYWQSVHFRVLLDSESPTDLEIVVPQNSGFIEITGLEIINALGSYAIDPNTGSKTLTAPWASETWLLNGDTMSYSLPAQQYDGNITIDGGEGIDTLVYPDNYSADYATINYSNIERISRDGYYALDLDGNGGDALKILNLVFGEEGLNNEAYRGAVLSFLDSGMSFDEVLGIAVNYQFGSDANYTNFITAVFNNLAGQPPSEADLNYFVSLLEDGTNSVIELASLAANHQLNLDKIDLSAYREGGIPYVPYQ